MSKAKLLALLAAIAVVLPTLVMPVGRAVATTIEPEPSDNVPKAITSYFDGPAAAYVSTVAGTDVLSTTIGAGEDVTFSHPRHVYGISDQLTSTTNVLVPTDYWIAQILIGGEPAGALAIAESQVGSDDPVVDDDARLTTEAGADPAESQLIYDTELEAWFAYRGESIEPANDAGANIVLGAVPIATFLKQRTQVLSEGESADTVDQPVQTAAPQDQGLSGLQIALVLLAMLAVALISLLWLRWDQTRVPDDGEDVEFLGGGGTLLPGLRRSRSDSFAKAEVLVKPGTEPLDEPAESPSATSAADQPEEEHTEEDER